MTYKCRKSFTSAKRAQSELKIGNGRTEAEELVRDFARQADITTEQGFAIMNDRSNHGVDTEKAAAFATAVRAEYGTVETFQYTCEAVTPGSTALTAPTPKVA